MSYTGRFANAEECARVGLYNAVFPDKDQMMTSALNLAREIAGKSPVAIVAIKKILGYARDHSVRDALDYTRTWNNAALQTQDIPIAITANLSKTKPVFPKL
jgi:enoyl-CoA hydratase